MRSRTKPKTKFRNELHRTKQEEYAKKLLFNFSVNQSQNQLTAAVVVTACSRRRIRNREIQNKMWNKVHINARNKRKHRKI